MTNVSQGATSLRSRYRSFADTAMTCVVACCCFVAVAVLAVILGYLLVHGLPALKWRILVTGPTPMGTPGGGLRNAIVGTLILIGLASCIGIPIGVLGGIYQLEFGGRFAWTVRFLTDVLNSVPSIVIGIFVYVIVVLPVARMRPGQGFSAIAGGVALAIIMIPTVMRTTEEILRLVPTALRDGSLALGATRWRTMLSVTLPAARTGVLTGIMLAMARVAGETAPLLFTAFGNVAFNVHLTKPIDALPLSVYYNATSPYEYLHQQALAGAIILILIVLTFSLAVRISLRGMALEER